MARSFLGQRSFSEVGSEVPQFFMYYAYILQLKDKSYYHGSSSDLKSRLEEHQSGIVESTKSLRPVKLVFYAGFVSKIKAINFEKYLKSSSGFAFRNKRLIEI